jgi:hypothetical protein
MKSGLENKVCGNLVFNGDGIWDGSHCGVLDPVKASMMAAAAWESLK